MGIVWVKEHFKNRGGQTDGVLSTNVNRHWIIKTDNQYDDFHKVGQDAVTTGALPDIFTPHPKFFAWTRRRLSIQPLPDGGKKLWDAVATYSSEPITDTERDRESVSQFVGSDPTERIAKVTFNQVQYQKAIVKARVRLIHVGGQAFQPPLTSGEWPLVNTAEDPFPAQLKDDARLVIKFEKNISTLPAWILNLKNTLNKESATIRGLTFPAETLKLAGLAISDLTIEGVFEYFKVSGEYHYREEGWDLELLSEGFNELEDDRITKKRIENAKGLHVTTPQLLDINGQAFDASQGADVEAKTTYQKYIVYDAKDHSPVTNLLPN